MISFIIPAYNEEKTIKAAVASVLAQKTNQRFEIIVVDNNSTDKTGEIVEKNFAQVKLVREQKAGTGWARNRGAQSAQGDILVFFDADAIVPEDWTEKMMQYLGQPQKYGNNQEALVAVGGPYKYKDLNWWERFWENAYLYVWLLPNRWVFNDFLKISSIVFGGNFAVRKSAFDSIGGFDTSLTFWGDDTDFAKRLMKKGKVAFNMDLFIETYARGLKYDNVIFEFLNGWKTAFKYAINFYWMTFFNKPFSRKIRVVR